MRQSSDGPARPRAAAAAATAAPAPPPRPPQRASPSLDHSTRKVRLTDHELFHCVQRVVVPAQSPVNLTRLSRKRGWKRIRLGVPPTMHMYCRVRDTARAKRQCQVAVGGDLRATLSELQTLVRASSESESNALLRALFGSQFIYSSLVHTVAAPTTASRSGPLDGPQLTVRTASFARKRGPVVFHSRPPSSATSRRGPPTTDDSGSGRGTFFPSRSKNDQCCYVELLTPTRNGFQVTFCTLDAADVRAGKAPPDRVVPLHLVSGWLVVAVSARDPALLHLTFHAAFPGTVPGGCDVAVAQHRLKCIAKGICRLDKVLRRRRATATLTCATAALTTTTSTCDRQCPTRDRTWPTWRHPFRGLTADDYRGNTHRNWHCIACTRSFFPTLRKCWRRCDLCAYRVCSAPPCCARERVAIYNRYIAPLTVCARCRECIDERASESHVRASGNDANNPLRSSMGDVRYTGVSLQFPERASNVEAELDVDSSSDGSHDRRWGSSGTLRFSHELRQPKQRTSSTSVVSTGAVNCARLSRDEDICAGGEEEEGEDAVLGAASTEL
ncbi:unnamed protein product [Hyaloperonospora brassicae]|uniref:FYVE-type domain-containing protein n=1 Tax=Hyaloperonospora brassicae TaxID=162125 RepID=A0AAV0V981_HYABA|nr:unnamed protein product [Hyaloperonospora brassicae]